MSRYRVVGAEAECEPGSNGLVLRNLLGITDPEEMANVEQGLLRELYQVVLSDPAYQGRLTTAMLTSWHSRWLENIYTWAGAERTVNVSKDGFLFAPALFIPDLLLEFQQQQLDALILIHPFREGNGRIARLLCDVMAFQAEIGPLDYTEWDRSPGEYFAAIQAGHGRDLEPMQQLFRRLLSAAD